MGKNPVPVALNDLIAMSLGDEMNVGMFSVTRVPFGWLYYNGKDIVYVPERSTEPQVVAITNHSSRVWY